LRAAKAVKNNLATKDHIERKEIMLFRPLPFLCDPSWQNGFKKSASGLGRWAFDVGCWTFKAPLFLSPVT
jgi:hypothetical protein